MELDSAENSKGKQIMSFEGCLSENETEKVSFYTSEGNTKIGITDKRILFCKADEITSVSQSAVQQVTVKKQKINYANLKVPLILAGVLSSLTMFAISVDSKQIVVLLSTLTFVSISIVFMIYVSNLLKTSPDDYVRIKTSTDTYDLEIENAPLKKILSSLSAEPPTSVIPATDE